jgi:hypothetical protein
VPGVLRPKEDLTTLDFCSFWFVFTFLNPHCPVTDLSEKFDLFDAFDVIGIFNNSIQSDLLLKHPTKVFVLNSGISASLLFSSPNPIFPHPKSSELTPIEQTIIGALISQMIVDYLPPLSSPISRSLHYDPHTWSSSIIISD